jgi:hypothetical protein
VEAQEISYWDHRVEDLKHQEQAGKPNARLNSNEARKRADTLQARLQKPLIEDVRYYAGVIAKRSLSGAFMKARDRQTDSNDSETGPRRYPQAPTCQL